jgi:hypothetical protein
MLTSPRGLEMKSYMPRLYAESRVMDELLEALGAEFDLLRAATEDLIGQFFATTATWALSTWERYVGLPDNEGLMTDVERRERIVARLVGYGVANKALIKEVADSYVYGDVEVYDQNDAEPAYTIRIEFVDELGIPAQIVDLQNVLRAIVPAHLAINYTYNFTLWNEIDTLDAGGAHTWNEIDVLDAGGPHTWDEMEVLV